MEQRVITLLEELEARSRSEQKELTALRERGVSHVLEAASRFMLDIGREAGQFINALVRMMGARTVVEVGASIGYSTIWFAEAAQAIGGKVISFEPDPQKTKELLANLERAGLQRSVEVISEDAAKVLPTLEGPFDIVLIDHWKHLYIREFELVWPKIRRGGVVLADNIILPATTAADANAYVAHVRKMPGARSFTLSMCNGIEVTVKE